MKAVNQISLSELQSRIRHSINASFPLPVWVCAEIAELKVNQSGHCYMELVEKGESDSVPKAKAQAVIWRNNFASVGAYFRITTGSELATGMKILAAVQVSYHELYGMSLVISDIDPTYTLGDWQAQRLKTIETLKRDGVWDMNRQLPVPPVFQKIAVISSATAAGYRDFINELNASPYRFDTELFESLVQGNDAEDSIVTALYQIAEREEQFDAVIIIRGGGSQSDLACFNSYRLCSCVAQFPIPVITGIGHDKDQSVTDMVACQALKTPTAVADYFVEIATNLDALLNELDDTLNSEASKLLDTQLQRLAMLSQATARIATDVRHNVELRLQSLIARLANASSATIRMQSDRTANALAQTDMYARILLQRRGDQLTALESTVRASSPERILSHGFAIVRANGHAISSAAQVAIGSTAEIELFKGKIKAKITDNGN